MQRSNERDPRNRPQCQDNVPRMSHSMTTRQTDVTQNRIHHKVGLSRQRLTPIAHRTDLPSNQQDDVTMNHEFSGHNVRVHHAVPSSTKEEMMEVVVKSYGVSIELSLAILNLFLGISCSSEIDRW